MCAVECDTPQEPSSKLGPGTSAFCQRTISINYYARVEQGDNPGQEKEGSTVSSIICNCCWVVSYAGVAEAERLGWLLAGATHSTSQDLARR